MANNPIQYLNEAMSAPLGRLIASIGEGVADAQAALDAGSLAQTLDLYDMENGDEMAQRLREIGYQPTFYVLPDTKVKAKMSITLSQTGSTPSLGNSKYAPLKIYATPMNGSNVNKYNLNIDASVELEFSIKPVPTPIGAELRRMPDLKGKTLEEATTILDQFGLSFNVAEGNDAKTITAQSPSKNNIVNTDTTVNLVFAK